ncbi:MAG: LacI family DNA-binding transcriptional regulator [Lachnospiraceae bacterium]
MKKITEKDIADALGISRVSVWKVFSGKSGTSEEMRQKVFNKARELGYPIPLANQPQLPESHSANTTSESSTNSKTIAVAVSHPETSIFWMSILHEIAKRASQQNYSMLYIYLPTNIPEDYQLSMQFFNGSIQGFIVLNIYNNRLLHLLNELDLPKVFLDITPSFSLYHLNGDLCFIEGFHEIAEITNHLISQGLKKIGFIGDINYAYTNQERYQGFLHAMQANQLPVNPDFCLTTKFSADSYAEKINEFLDQLTTLPEAIICANDYVANILWNSLEQRGYQIPQDIAISGFDGTTEISHSNELTTVLVNTKRIGTRLAKQLFYRMQYTDAGKELIYIRSEVKLSRSTQILQD